MAYRLPLILFFAMFSGCKYWPFGADSHQENKQLQFSKIRFDAPREDFLAPVEMKKQVDKIFFDHIVMPKDADSSENKVFLEVPKRFFSFRLKVVEESRGSIGGENFEIQFPKGGGVLDFADLPLADAGLISLHWEFPDEMSQDKKMRVFYLSNARTRSVEGQKYGAGCKSFFDITDFFFKENGREGIRLNLAKGRHVTVMAGTYVFAQPVNDALLLAQLIIKDDRYRPFHCRYN